MLPHPDALTVNGENIGMNCKGKLTGDARVIKSVADPLKTEAGFINLKGNLFDSAIMKMSVVTETFKETYLSNPDDPMAFEGRAIVFEGTEDYHKRIDDPAENIDENCILFMRGVGPKGYPGFPEVGNMTLPAKLLKKGITDMVRISDARMSGTAYGTVLLHTAPESAVGGPLALVKEGDLIEINVARRLVKLHVSDKELEARRAAFKPQKPPKRGYARIFHDHIEQANTGCDFDFLVGSSGAPVPRESH